MLGGGQQLSFWDFFLLCGCSYPQSRDSQSVGLVVLFSCRLLRGVLPVAGLWPCFIYPALLVFCSVVDSCGFSLFPACGGRCWPLTVYTV